MSSEKLTFPTPNYPVDLFAGTARYYAQYRVPYPQVLIDDLRDRANIGGLGHLLDLGCGPGRVTLRLAPYFKDVWAIDLEPEMIDVAKEEAKKLGIANVTWKVGRAEDLAAPEKAFELITIGEAFHRFDQNTILKRAQEWLKPRGYLATLGGYGILRGHEPWQRLLAEIVDKWKKRVANKRPKREKQIHIASGADHDQAVLKAAGFVDVENFEFPHPFIWTLDAVIGNLYSASGNLKGSLGDDVDAFEKDIRDALLNFDARGEYRETSCFGYTLARWPK